MPAPGRASGGSDAASTRRCHCRARPSPSTPRVRFADEKHVYKRKAALDAIEGKGHH